MKRLLLCSLLVAATVTLAGQARATPAVVPCQQTDTVTDTTGFNDCAGRTVTVNTFGSFDIGISHSGTWDLSDWFTDLHVTFDPSVNSVSSLGGSFTNITKNVSWTAETMVVGADGTGMVWFTADQFADRVELGDQYQWDAFASFSFNSIGGVDVTIEYTRDVPEPALGLVLLGGLVSLALVRRRAA